MKIGSRKFLNLVYAWCLRMLSNGGKKPDEIEEWIRGLEAPLPGEKPAKAIAARPDDLQEDARAFMQAQAQLKQLTT